MITRLLVGMLTPAIRATCFSVCSTGRTTRAARPISSRKHARELEKFAHSQGFDLECVQPSRSRVKGALRPFRVKRQQLRKRKRRTARLFPARSCSAWPAYTASWPRRQNGWAFGQVRSWPPLIQEEPTLRAGCPATCSPSTRSRLTTVPGSTRQSAPIRTPGMTIARVPITLRGPITVSR